MRSHNFKQKTTKVIAQCTVGGVPIFTNLLTEQQTNNTSALFQNEFIKNLIHNLTIKNFLIVKNCNHPLFAVPLTKMSVVYIHLWIPYVIIHFMAICTVPVPTQRN